MDSSVSELRAPVDQRIEPRLAYQTGWIPRIRTGDITAFEALFRRYYGPLCIYARGFVRCPDTSEEIVTELLERIWEERDQWLVRGSLRRHLYAAVRSKALKHLRDREIREPLHERIDVRGRPPGMGTPPGSPEDELSARELHDFAAAVVESLPPRCREAFLLSRQQGLTHAEIAERMGIASGTVESHVRHATSVLAYRLWERTQEG